MRERWKIVNRLINLAPFYHLFSILLREIDFRYLRF